MKGFGGSAGGGGFFGSFGRKSGGEDENSGDTGGQQHNTQPPKSSNVFDSEEFDADFVWGDKPANPEQTQPTQQMPNITVQMPQEPIAPNEQLQNLLKGVGLGDLALSEEQQEAVRSGNGEVIMNLLQQNHKTAQTAFIQAVKSMNEHMSTEIAKAVKDAVGQSTAHYSAEVMRTRMVERFPAAKDPALAPVIESIVKRSMDKGASPEQAFSVVDRWLAKITQISLDQPTKISGSMIDGFTPQAPTKLKDEDWAKFAGLIA